MRRKLPSEQVERLRLDRLPEAETLRRRCARWSQDVLPVLCATDPVMPESLHDRAADNWRPLCAIVEGVGGTGPQRAAQAIKALTPQELDDEAGALCFLQSECFMIRPRQAGTLGRTPGQMAIVRLCALRALRGATRYSHARGSAVYAGPGVSSIDWSGGDWGYSFIWRAYGFAPLLHIRHPWKKGVRP